MVIQDEFQIQELAEKAGTSLRTIRYYTQEGLLPEPASRGKYAVYNQEHLDRLLLIRHLKETYLPLKEIRQLLGSFSWPEVRALLDNKEGIRRALEPRRATPSGGTAPGAESALDYVNRLLNTRSEPGTASGRISLARPTVLSDPLSQVSSVPPESWRHFILAPGIELHIKEPLTSADHQQIEDFIEYAKRLFSKSRK